MATNVPKIANVGVSQPVDVTYITYLFLVFSLDQHVMAFLYIRLFSLNSVHFCGIFEDNKK